MTRSRPALFFGLLAAAVVAVVAVSIAIASDGADGPEAPITVSDLVSDPQAYADGPIRVTEQVREVRDPFFTLGDEELLVHQPPESPFIVTRADAIAVEGELQRFEVDDFETRYGGSYDEFADLAGELVVDATRLDPDVPGDGTAALP